jgi:hypothetical protein
MTISYILNRYTTLLFWNTFDFQILSERI